MIYFSVLLPIMSSLFMIQRYVSCTEYLLHAFFFLRWRHVLDCIFFSSLFKIMERYCTTMFCTVLYTPCEHQQRIVGAWSKTPPGVNRSWVSELLGKDYFFSVYSSSIHNFPEICLGLETSFNKVDVFYWKYKENIATDCHCYCRSGRS
jgi:hypothetical protein